jgi:hypothetical protein
VPADLARIAREEQRGSLLSAVVLDERLPRDERLALVKRVLEAGSAYPAKLWFESGQGDDIVLTGVTLLMPSLTEMELSALFPTGVAAADLVLIEHKRLTKHHLLKTLPGLMIRNPDIAARAFQAGETQMEPEDFRPLVTYMSATKVVKNVYELILSSAKCLVMDADDLKRILIRQIPCSKTDLVSGSAKSGQRIVGTWDDQDWEVWRDGGDVVGYYTDADMQAMLAILNSPNVSGIREQVIAELRSADVALAVCLERGTGEVEQ